MEVHEADTPKGAPNKGALQTYLQTFTREAIDILVDTMRNSRNEGVKFAAAKLVVDKSIADVRAVEVGGLNGEPIKFTIVAGSDYTTYISGLNKTLTASTGSPLSGSDEVQGAGVAQESSQDNNSDNTTGKVGTA